MLRTHFNIVIDLLFTRCFLEGYIIFKFDLTVYSKRQYFYQNQLTEGGWGRGCKLLFPYHTIYIQCGEGDKGLTLLFLCTVEDTAPWPRWNGNNVQWQANVKKCIEITTRTEVYTDGACLNNLRRPIPLLCVYRY